VAAPGVYIAGMNFADLAHPGTPLVVP
jgi:hypothetical protein